MNILAIDAACSTLSIAVARNDEIIYEVKDSGTKQSEIIMDCIDSLMKKASLKPQALNGVLCMGGPGSFTGLRIGYSIAKGLALSLSIPFVPVPTLDCIAFQRTGINKQINFNNEQSTMSNEKIENNNNNNQRSEEIILTVIEARKGAFFYAFFNGYKRLTPDADGTTGQITDIIRKADKGKITAITGPGAQLLYDALPQELKTSIISDSEIRGYAKELILIAKNNKLFDNDNSVYLFSGPEYLRKTDAELSLK
ncbi:MAG: tRNA (adenosine(37)-N6)-threonylcarbamoyltransferase complex dimerization subunit type 1 TsaB [Treponema sp.]|nr:tRNA (adenosine(37)-N6)-threonylcarbamoyltransferase complex dimerization subunit type 1 TsaB [Treponema sp.]